MDFGNHNLRFLQLRKQIVLTIAFNCFFSFLPKPIMAEMITTASHDITNPEISTSLPHKLREFNKQLSILEKIIDKKLKVDSSFN